MVRPMVRPLVRGPVGPRYGGAAYHDGIAYNAETGRVVLKAVGAAPTITTLTSAFTFTGGNQSMYMGPAGLLVQSAANTPRIEYDASGNCLGLLMEASRTNLCLQSQNLSTTWTLSGATASANSIAAPDGTTTADTLVESVGGTFHLARQDVTITANSAYTFSLFVKAAGRTSCKLQVSNTLENTGSNVDVNLSAGTVGTVTNFGTGASSAATITAFSNGWYRVSLRTTIDAASTTGRVQVLLSNPVGTISYSGDGASGLYLWGMQYELGQFPSSYIPTTTLAVARTADSCIRTLGSEFSATAGTVVVNVADFISADVAANNCIASLDDATANERYTLQRTNTAGAMRLNVFDGGANQAAIDGLSVISTAGVRLAYAYAANDFAISGNGGAVATDVAGTLPTVTRLDLGSRLTGEHLWGHIRRFDYYPTRLPNTFLVSAST